MNDSQLILDYFVSMKSAYNNTKLKDISSAISSVTFCHNQSESKEGKKYEKGELEEYCFFFFGSLLAKRMSRKLLEVCNGAQMK